MLYWLKIKVGDLVIEEIKKYDAFFLESKFKSFVDNVFIQIHLAIMARDIERVKHFVSNEIYQKLEQRVADLKSQGWIQMYDEINVKNTVLMDMNTSDSKIFIKVNLTSRYMDYIVDENMKYLEGNKDFRVEKENYLVFCKKIECLDNESIRRCFSCGHPMDVNQNGKCDYCGTIYDQENVGWVLVSFEGV